MQPTETDLKELARHLRCPDGQDGIKVGEMMNFSNANIINKAIESLDVKDNERILEIGPGNGSHVKDVIAAAKGITYTGVDISSTMVAEAQKINEAFSNASFLLTDGQTLPFKNNAFKKVFTTNTIYFWKDPQEYALEIARVLKQGGLLSLGFIPKRIMEKIPFTKYGFNLWDEAAVASLLEKAGFEIKSEITETETITSLDGQPIERDYVVVIARKL